LKHYEVAYLSLGKEIESSLQIPKEIQALNDEFFDITPEELPIGFPPTRDIQYHINLIPSAI